MTQISICQSQSVTIQATGTITGAANNGSGAIRLTVVGHGLSSGSWVQVAGVGGVPAATGLWQVNVVTANSYDLLNSNFAGSFTSGGTSQNVGFSVTPNLLTPPWQSATPTSATLVFLLQSAPSGASLRWVFQDAEDPAFVTAMPLATGSFAGSTSASCDRRWDSLRYDTPDWILQQLNDYLKLIVFFPQMSAGQSLKFSSWIEF